MASAQGRENQSLTKRLKVEFVHFLGLFKFYRKEDEIHTQVPSWRGREYPTHQLKLSPWEIWIVSVGIGETPPFHVQVPSDNPLCRSHRVKGELSEARELLGSHFTKEGGYWASKACPMFCSCIAYPVSNPGKAVSWGRPANLWPFQLLHHSENSTSWSMVGLKFWPSLSPQHPGLKGWVQYRWCRGIGSSVWASGLSYVLESNLSESFSLREETLVQSFIVPYM